MRRGHSEFGVCVKRFGDDTYMRGVAQEIMHDDQVKSVLSVGWVGGEKVPRERSFSLVPRVESNTSPLACTYHS